MDATLRYWRDLLGMRLVAGMGRPGYRIYFMEISDTDLLGFFEWPRARPLDLKDHGVPVSGPAAFDHLSFGVAADSDLHDIKDRLDAAGFWVSEVIDHGFIHSIYSFDPNNIPVEFSAPVPGVDVRARPTMADRHPCAEAGKGPEPVPGAWPPVTEPTPEEDRTAYPGDGAEDFVPDRLGLGWDPE
jgi:catechol 2,3-dioxygenase-like lactoylglutathione lyase family enzyme